MLVENKRKTKSYHYIFFVFLQLNKILILNKINIMKAEITSTLLFIAWTMLGIPFYVINLFFSFIFFPLLLILVEKKLKYRLNHYILPIYLIFFLVINDYFLRFYSYELGGSLGSFLCEISFYLSLKFSIFSVIAITSTRKKIGGIKTFYYLLYLIILVIIVIIIYGKVYNSELF